VHFRSDTSTSAKEDTAMPVVAIIIVAVILFGFPTPAY
jgi:hypothetical protein